MIVSSKTEHKGIAYAVSFLYAEEADCDEWDNTSQRGLFRVGVKDMTFGIIEYMSQVRLFTHDICG